MKKKICLHFQLHQPFWLKRYGFFNIGNDHHYYDDHINSTYTRRMAEISYLPVNRILLDAINELKGKFKMSFSISGTILDKFELYAPEMLDSFRELADTKCVEFVAGTDAHSIASLIDKEEFVAQVNAHKEKILMHFGRPVGDVFCNSNMIYNNDVGETIEEMGFHGVLTEGARYVLGQKSPNHLYQSATNPRLKLLLRNSKLSDDIRFIFSNHKWNEFPMTAEKMVHWIDMLDPKEELVVLSLNYAIFGQKQSVSTDIFEFLKHLLQIALKKKFSFVTPTELLRQQPVSPLNLQYPGLWTDEEYSSNTWYGNDMQKEAINKLYGLAERVRRTPDPKIKTDWKYLQSSNHFRYMITGFRANEQLGAYKPYETPYDAFINYMNVLTDFVFRLKKIDSPIEKTYFNAAG